MRNYFQEKREGQRSLRAEYNTLRTSDGKTSDVAGKYAAKKKTSAPRANLSFDNASIAFLSLYASNINDTINIDNHRDRENCDKKHLPSIISSSHLYPKIN